MLPRYYTYYNKQVEENLQIPPPSISGFYNWLEVFEQSEEKEFDRLSRTFDFIEFSIVLEPFATGEYKEVLNSSTHEDVTEEKLICFYMARIKKNPIL